MKCSACKDRLPAYRDGELSPADRALMAAHVSACPSCAQHARMLDELDRLLVNVRPMQPRADFTIGVMARVAAMPVVKPAWNGYRFVAAFVAAEIVAIAAAFIAGLIDVHAIAAMAGALVGKLAVAVSAIVQVALDFHLGPVAMLGAGLEIAVVALAFFAARNYFNRRSLRPHTYGV